MAREGAKVGALGRTASQLDAVVAEIESQGGAAMALLADVSQPQPVERAVERLVSEWGRLDIVFANAGVNGVWAPLDQITPEEWDETLSINLKGTFLTVKYALPHLRRRGGAIIVNSSVNGTRMFSNSGATAYSCSKAAQVAFVKMAALELARDRIRVNAICPGWVRTEIGDNTRVRDLDRVRPRAEFPDGIVPLTGGQPGTPEQVAELVLFLASDAAAHITGSEMWIDGGQSLLQG